MLIVAFKKEFQKLGEAFDALSKSFEYDDRKGKIIKMFIFSYKINGTI